MKLAPRFLSSSRPAVGDLPLVERVVVVVVPQADAVERGAVAVAEVSPVGRDGHEAVMGRWYRLEGAARRLSAVPWASLTLTTYRQAPVSVGANRTIHKARPARRIVESPDPPGLARRRGELGPEVDLLGIEGIGVGRLQVDVQFELLVEADVFVSERTESIEGPSDAAQATAASPGSQARPRWT